MLLKNKKTGEIGYTAVLRAKAIVVMDENAIQLGSYTSLAELCEEWEDYEELKDHWYIYGSEPFEVDEQNWDKDYIAALKSIGNYFDTREEAVKAVEKLKAYKRLKDKGFRFVGGWLDNNDDFIIKAKLGHAGLIDQPDVHLLFGGEE